MEGWVSEPALTLILWKQSKFVPALPSASASTFQVMSSLKCAARKESLRIVSTNDSNLKFKVILKKKKRKIITPFEPKVEHASNLRFADAGTMSNEKARFLFHIFCYKNKKKHEVSAHGAYFVLRTPPSFPSLWVILAQLSHCGVTTAYTKPVNHRPCQEQIRFVRLRSS